MGCSGLTSVSYASLASPSAIVATAISRTRCPRRGLVPLDRDDRPLGVAQALLPLPVWQLRGGQDPEARTLELEQRRLVPGVRDDDARAHGEEIACRRPLLALLQRAAVAAAEHRLEWLVHRVHRGEEIRHLPNALRPLAPVQHREP